MIQEEDGHRWLSRNLSIRMIAKKISSSVVVRRETSLSEIEEEQSATDDSLEDVEEQGTEPDKEPEKTKRKYATAADKLTNLFDDYWEKKQRADEAKSKGKEERDQKREERKDKRHKD